MIGSLLYSADSDVGIDVSNTFISFFKILHHNNDAFRVM